MKRFILCLMLTVCTAPALAEDAEPLPEMSLNETLLLLREIRATEAALSAPEPKKKAISPLVKQLICGPEAKAEEKKEEKKAEALSPETKESIKRQISACWIPSQGSTDEIGLTLAFNEDGTVSSAKLSDDQMGKYKQDIAFHSMVDSLRRAAFHPRCVPVKDLPKDKYETWKEVSLTFKSGDAPR
jgi:hypothetical protein